MSERTLVLVKPDGVRRGLVGEVIAPAGAQGPEAGRAGAAHPRHGDGRGALRRAPERPFFGELVEFITGGPLVALVVEGPRAIEAFRALAGATDPVEAAPGTIRGDYALEIGENIVHGSDSPDSAAREIKIFFPGPLSERPRLHRHCAQPARSGPRVSLHWRLRAGSHDSADSDGYSGLSAALDVGRRSVA